MDLEPPNPVQGLRNYYELSLAPFCRNTYTPLIATNNT